MIRAIMGRFNCSNYLDGIVKGGRFVHFFLCGKRSIRQNYWLFSSCSNLLSRLSFNLIKK